MASRPYEYLNKKTKTKWRFQNRKTKLNGLYICAYFILFLSHDYKFIQWIEKSFVRLFNYFYVVKSALFKIITYHQHQKSYNFIHYYINRNKNIVIFFQYIYSRNNDKTDFSHDREKVCGDARKVASCFIRFVSPSQTRRPFSRRPLRERGLLSCRV